MNILEAYDKLKTYWTILEDILNATEDLDKVKIKQRIAIINLAKQLDGCDFYSEEIEEILS